MLGRTVAVHAVVLSIPISAGLATSAGESAAPPLQAAITGVVFDSLVSNGPLAGAEVSLEGTALIAVTDNEGRFRLDAVPPGRAVIRFFHSTLDSLGFGAAPVAVAVPDSGAVRVRLATPAPATLHAKLCPGAQPPSTGVLLGRVRNVDGRAPLAGADVAVHWGVWTVGSGGLTRSEDHTATTTDSSGAYVVCGVPTDVAVAARATASGHVTGLVEIDFAQRPFGVRDFAVGVADDGATAARLAQLDSLIARGDSVTAGGSASIGGVVRGPDGRALDQAQVALFGFPLSVRTSSDGTYRLVGVPAGSQTIEVRAVGFAPTRLTLELATGESRTADVTITRAAQALASVNIVGRGKSVDMTGFDDRRKAGIGQFIGEEEIKRRGVFETTQALWNVSGARVVWDGYSNVVMFTRPTGTGRVTARAGSWSVGGYNTLCAPAYWVDGFAMPMPGPSGEANDADTFVRPHDIRGIEVYIDPSSVPSRYRRPDVQCGVILIWTKPPLPRKPTGG